MIRSASRPYTRNIVLVVFGLTLALAALLSANTPRALMARRESSRAPFAAPAGARPSGLGVGFNPWTLGNYSNTSAPLGANTTITPDAAPINATGINASTSPNFKGKIEGDPTTGVLRVTNAQPAGIYLVKVTAFDVDHTTKTFTLTVTTPFTCNPVVFAPPKNLAIGTFNNPTSIAVGDFNGDGKQDLVVTEQGFSKVWILLGDGSGGFGAATSINVGSGAPQSVAVGDFNGDGKQDLAIASFNTNNVAVMFGNGSGSFAAPSFFAAGSNPSSIAIGDFNKDAVQDLVVAHFGSNTVSVFLGNGTGGFGNANDLTVANGSRAVAIGDFDNDGNQDLAVADQNANAVSVLLGNGTGSFAPRSDFAVGNFPGSIAVGDFNGDGRQDLATTDELSNEVSVLLGNGAGGFGAVTNFGVGARPFSVVVGDFNGDGKQDLATANFSANSASVLLGDGAGGFSSLNESTVGTNPVSLAIGDFNGDGTQDLATANVNSSNVSVLIRDCAILVTNTNDSGTGSLRQAILDANGTGKTDTIAFAIPGAGVHTITPTTALPNITGSVVIDGYSQPGSSPNSRAVGDNAVLQVQITGSSTIQGAALTITAADCVIKGLVINGFNQLSGGLGDGSIEFNGAGATGGLVQGCFLGTDVNGTTAVPSLYGVLIVDGAQNNTIGGTTPAARNLISGNQVAGVGIGVGAADNGLSNNNRVQGNIIGADKTGASPLPNSYGIFLQRGAKNNQIGGVAAGAGNFIAFNANSGVVLSGGGAAPTNDAIRNNSIHDNGSLGIDLSNIFGGDGVTPDDTGDADSGANNLQNFPVLTSASSSGTTTTVTGTLNSTANTTFTIDFFSNVFCDSTGNGEGQTLLGSTDVVTDGSGNANINTTLGVATTVGQLVTANATDPNGNTSEFSFCRQLGSGSCVAPPSGMVAWYPGDGNANDIQGGNNGILGGDANATATGEVSNAFGFSGAGKVEVPDSPSLNPQNLTIDAWVFPTVVDGVNDIIVNKEGTGTVQYEMSIRGSTPFPGSIPQGNLAVFIGGISGLPDDEGGWVNGGGQVPLNAWTHVAMTFDGSSLTVYINGVQTRSISGLTGSIPETNAPFRIGARNPASGFANDPFNGSIDEVELFNRALTQNEIQNIVTAGSAGKCKPTYQISGRVLDDSGHILMGIAMSLSGSAADNTTTDDGGSFTFSNLVASGNYTVTPSSTDYSFAPVDQSFSGLHVNSIANFVGKRTVVSITGTVTDGTGAGMNNVSVHLSKNGGEALGGTTDVNGNYQINNLQAGANYVVTPVGSFSPLSRSFSNLTVNASANFAAIPLIPPQCSTASFAAPTSFAVGGNARALAVGDLNGDGKLDLAVANRSSNNVSLLLGNGAGGFAPAANFAVGTNPEGVTVGDFNGDGKQDLAVANITSGNVSVLLGNGAGSFGQAANFNAGTGPHSLVVGDFNGDSKQDLAVANITSNNVSILLGNGLGSFSAAVNLAVGTNPTSIVLGDFNADGKQDLATANSNSNNVSVLLGDGAGGFAAATNFAAFGAFAIAMGDFNTDGKQDLVTTNIITNNISVLLGDGTGSFGAETNFNAALNPNSIVVADFNGDGKSDLVVGNQFTVVNDLVLLLGNGAGSFSSPSPFGVAQAAQAVTVGDFNSDGKLDLAEAYDQPNVSVLLNNGATCNTQGSLTISGQVTDDRNNPMPNVTVTLSGTVTRVVQTDSGGNYSFSNLTAGGNYSVTLQSNYFVFSDSRADFFNLSSNQTPNFIAAPIAIPTATPPLTDDFSGPTRDTNKWNLGTLALPPQAVDPQVTTAQINGQLVITPLTQVAGMHYNGYVSANSFDMRNGKVSVEVVKAATGGGDTIFAIGSDVDNFARFVVHTLGAPSTVITPTRAGQVTVPLDATAGALLVFQVRVAGVLTSLSIPYDPVQQRFMRFRHVPAINSIVFETSPNDVDYTIQHTVVLQKGVSALTAELSAGTANPANPGAAVFDNFGLVTSTFQFSTGAFSVGENDGRVSITVTRAGSTTNAASVDFATADGTAQQRTKYINATGRLNFAPGELSKSFDVLIEDNSQAEGNENVNLLLMNPIGSGLNSPGRALLNIIDNDTALPTGNPLDDPRFFVQQNYFDFLNRTPDQGGFDFWTNVITGPPACAPSDANCLRERRITVSNAFFFELEFQQTGAYVFRVYRAAFGNHQPFPNSSADPQHPGEAEKLVSYTAFAADRARVVGGSALAQAQLDYANEFVQRPEFLAKYPATLDGPAFVDALLGTIMNDLGVNLGSQRSALINLFNLGGRGNVLYRLADDNVQTNPINNRPLIDAEYVRSFVATQYFGYLRRDADIGGFLFWLGQVNSAPLRDLSKQRAMVCSFITAAEFQQRFSLIVTHTNDECPH